MENFGVCFWIIEFEWFGIIFTFAGSRQKTKNEYGGGYIVFKMFPNSAQRVIISGCESRWGGLLGESVWAW